MLLAYRTSSALNTAGIVTIGEVMFTPGTELLAWKNFGRKSLNELKKVVRSLCLTGSYTPHDQGDKSISIDYTSYEDMVSSFTAACLKKKRDQELFQQKFCFPDGKIPTLEELGRPFGITRERVRQIVKKGIRKFGHWANLIKLEYFWEKIDHVVASGGGVMHLRSLPALLQDEFKWPTAPHSLALGQFLTFWQPSSKFKDDSDFITVDCECLSCDQPLEQLNKLDFSVHASFHIEVLGIKLGEHCKTNCPWKTPVIKFHNAFVEQLIDQAEGRFICHGEVVLSRNNWLEKYCNSLEDVACHILESHGKPMHFSEIASQVRSKNQNFSELSDHNLHAAIIRYDKIKIVSRGTYGLKSWDLSSYRSVSSAIEEFIDAEGLPQRRQAIIQHLEGEFTEGNITAALSTETRFRNIGDGIYDRQENWQKRTLDELIKLLPDSVEKFAQYLKGKNNTSYKLVMAFIFIRSMDEEGSIYLSKLKDMFYNFYLSRYKKGLAVEVGSAAMSRIGELSGNDVKNRTCQEPLKSFQSSSYFVRYSQNGRKLKLTDTVFSKLHSIPVRDILFIVILKAIDNYYQIITPDVGTYEESLKAPSNTSKAEGISEEGNAFSIETARGPSQSLHIRKKRRGRIKL